MKTHCSPNKGNTIFVEFAGIIEIRFYLEIFMISLIFKLFLKTWHLDTVYMQNKIGPTHI